MIKSFTCRDTQLLWAGRRIGRFVAFETTAIRKLQQLQGREKANTASVSTTNGGYVLFGATDTPGRLKSSTITDKEHTMKREVPLVHPGEILLNDWLEPLGISQYALAKAIDVPRRRINEIVLGQRAISADTAARLGAFFGVDAEGWLALQAHHDAELTRERLAEVLPRIPHYGGIQHKPVTA